MARQQYYPNYNRYGRRRRINPKGYMTFIIIAFLGLVGGFIFNIFYQEIPTVDRWHNKEAKFVYLTFDDGPSKNATKILDVLDSYDIKGTFFVLGSSIEGYSEAKDILKRMADTGHYIGMHSMSHDYAYLYDTEKGGENFVGELLEEQNLIKDITGGFISQLCRAPYGSGGTFTPAHIESLKEAGIKCWDWDVDSLDWERGATVDSIMKNIEYCMNLWNYPRNTIVLFHEKDVTIEVLPRVIEYYTELGYEFLPYNPEHHLVKNLYGSDEI